MAILHVLVLAVLVLGGLSTSCVEWRIANPPIIFGKTVQLLSSPITQNISSNIYNITSWIGGKNYSVLTYNGGTADPKKYAEMQRWHRGKFESILQIYKFDEMDVNVNYACSIGGCENRKMLSLTPDKFEYHPDKDTTSILTNFRNGYLDVLVKIIKVYPIPECTIMFNDNIISRRLTTKTLVNGIFYMVVQEVEHYFEVCSGQLIVTCVVGKTEIPIHQETFNRCNTSNTKTKEESPEYINYLMISIISVVIVFINLILCRVKWRQSKNLCCNGEEMTLMKCFDRRLATHDKEGPIHDTGQEECMLRPSSKPDNYGRNMK